MVKYCKCKGGLVMLDLEKIKSTCPLCNLPKKIKGQRTKGFLKMAKLLKKENSAKE